MEPKRQTAHELLAVQQELIDREPIFHRPEHGTTRRAFESMTAERRSHGSWVAVYHQGTMVEEP